MVKPYTYLSLIITLTLALTPTLNSSDAYFGLILHLMVSPNSHPLTAHIDQLSPYSRNPHLHPNRTQGRQSMWDMYPCMSAPLANPPTPTHPQQPSSSSRDNCRLGHLQHGLRSPALLTPSPSLYGQNLRTLPRFPPTSHCKSWTIADSSPLRSSDENIYPAF